MTKAKAKRPPGKLWAWDIEATEWDRVLCAVAVSTDGDVERWQGPHCLEDVAAFMLKHRGTWCAHYGGGYDVPLLLNHHRFSRIVLSGSNILSAEEGRTLKLRDTFPWWLASLEKVGKAVGVHKSAHVDRQALADMSMADVLAYCEQDCRVELAGVLAAQGYLAQLGAQKAWTAGASAVSCLRALEPASWGLLRRHAVPIDMLRAALPSIRGGRVECWARGEVDPVYCYDFKSSYPARYALEPVGVGLRPAEADDVVGVWWCEWVWPWRDRVPPALDAATGCGAGRCAAWLITEEIAALERCGVAVVKGEGWAPETIAPIGQTFAATLFAAKESGGPNAFFSKVWVNSWHGKTSEDPVKESYTKTRPLAWADVADPELVGGADGWWRWYEIREDAEGNAAPHAQPIMAAQILGRARVALWEALRAVQEAGGRIFYSDTDSVMCDLPPERMPVQLGAGLGQLAFEGGPYAGIFLGPKAYLLYDGDGVAKQALKGVPLRSYTRGLRDRGGVFREARDSPQARDVRLDVFRAALDGGAKCQKDGISSFLRGLHGFDSGDGRGRVPARWARAPAIREVRPTGRGRVIRGGRWSYITPTESQALELARELPRRVAFDDPVGGWLTSQGLALRNRATLELSSAGRDWLARFDSVTLEPDPDADEPDDD